MKRVLAIVAAGLAALAVYAMAAPASEQAVTPKQFSALSKKVKNLQSQVKHLEGCLTAAPVSAYGDEQNQSEGYLYVNAQNPNGFLTSAIDFTDAAHAQTFMVTTSSNCIKTRRTKVVSFRAVGRK
jgi:hypothetical protein